MSTNNLSETTSPRAWAQLRAQIAIEALGPGGSQQEIFERYAERLRQPKWEGSPLEPIGFERVLEDPVLLNSIVIALESGPGLFSDERFFILGGEKDDGNQHPQVSALRRYNIALGQIEPTSTQVIGSGARISSDILLTAAHVVKKYIKATDRLGIFGGVLADQGEQMPNKIKTHEDFDSDLQINDLAVIRLPEGATDSSPILQFIGTNDFPRAESWRAVGYGIDPKAKENLTGIRRFTPGSLEVELCSAASPTSHGCHLGKELVARRHGAEIDTCYGDSGGPLLAKVDGEWQIAGISSRRLGSNECGAGSIYTRVDPYLPWIRDAIQELGGEMPPQLVEV